MLERGSFDVQSNFSLKFFASVYSGSLSKLTQVALHRVDGQLIVHIPPDSTEGRARRKGKKGREGQKAHLVGNLS